MNISKKYSGIGKSAKKYKTKINKPPKSKGIFGNIGIEDKTLCI